VHGRDGVDHRARELDPVAARHLAHVGEPGAAHQSAAAARHDHRHAALEPP
jgi:hypothetical protein